MLSMKVESSACQWEIWVGGDRTTACFEPAYSTAPDPTLFVCAHGAGGHMDDRGMVALSEQFRRRGIGVVRFNFLYRAKNSARPDAMPRLKECFAAVTARAREELEYQRFIVGGRSMGGRTASMLAADGLKCEGVLLLAYPLHPAGQPEKLRDAHLHRIGAPVLCLNGTRDKLCDRKLMDRVVQKLEDNWTMHWLEGADHSFHVLKSSGRSDADVLNEVGDQTAVWLSR
jgi:uncharacterized protein